MEIGSEEILETIRMVELQNLDIRAVTISINLLDCSHSDIKDLQSKITQKIVKYAKSLVKVCQEIESIYGIPIVNERIAVTPISLVGASCNVKNYVPIAKTLDEAAKKVGVDFIGGFSALVEKGLTKSDLKLIDSIPEALASTDFVCSSVNVAATKVGINMDAVIRMGRIIKETAELTAKNNGIGCAKLGVFANLPGDVPFMPGAIHGVGQSECVINVGVSGPGVVKSVLGKMADANLNEMAEVIKKTSFKITRMGELVGREVAEKLKVEFGSVDLSLAPTTKVGDSIAQILELMGLEVCGTHGTTAALALLTDAVKKGGAMASSSIGGFSGAFIPVCEDRGMVEAVRKGAIGLDKLEAMTSVCAVGLDMVVVPGNSSEETISAIIADEMVIGVINNKTTGVRIIPAPGKKAGEKVKFVGHKGLLGEGIVMPVNKYGAKKFIQRGGKIPAPLRSLGN